MRIIDYMRHSLIFLDLEAANKEEAIIKTVELMKARGAVKNVQKFVDAVFERESLGSTAIGKGVALPHARTQEIDQITIAMTRLKKGVDFGAADGEPVNLIFLLGTPLKAVSEYLAVLAKLSRLIREDKTRKRLLKAKTLTDVETIFNEIEP
ncbi:MAG: PTS sugar transporter subunit IIA [candidate division KSB1 bacterium]|nr:PTS sugar transporter subunit IIA [candidate division KSB1 bacterium]